ncbi:hypothetical protein NLX78_14570 [Paenibacillus sp. Lou8.1]|uniref:hypothetical protein n=1 Tax=Paenibacillus sp. Lou8.1 TaxID=2962041 RepID=UPI0020B8D091|nr:hypothetical protein [Paenibacillus sp. Lou8.1]MCP3808460.1 hypothetical protein [Paenibacillus sp. Lou8.1]
MNRGIQSPTNRTIQHSVQREIEIIEGILESKAQYRKIVKAGIAQWVKDLQAGNIKMQTVQDLDRLIELDIKLQKDEL